jgi:hypothetical protein
MGGGQSIPALVSSLKKIGQKQVESAPETLVEWKKALQHGNFAGKLELPWR